MAQQLEINAFYDNDNTMLALIDDRYYKIDQRNGQIIVLEARGIMGNPATDRRLILDEVALLQLMGLTIGPSAYPLPLSLGSPILSLGSPTLSSVSSPTLSLGSPTLSSVSSPTLSLGSPTLSSVGSPILSLGSPTLSLSPVGSPILSLSPVIVTTSKPKENIVQADLYKDTDGTYLLLVFGKYFKVKHLREWDQEIYGVRQVLGDPSKDRPLHNSEKTSIRHLLYTKRSFTRGVGFPGASRRTPLVPIPERIFIRNLDLNVIPMRHKLLTTLHGKPKGLITFSPPRLLTPIISSSSEKTTKPAKVKVQSTAFSLANIQLDISSKIFDREAIPWETRLNTYKTMNPFRAAYDVLPVDQLKKLLNLKAQVSYPRGLFHIKHSNLTPRERKQKQELAELERKLIPQYSWWYFGYFNTEDIQRRLADSSTNEQLSPHTFEKHSLPYDLDDYAHYLRCFKNNETCNMIRWIFGELAQLGDTWSSLYENAKHKYRQLSWLNKYKWSNIRLYKAIRSAYLEEMIFEPPSADIVERSILFRGEISGWILRRGSVYNGRTYNSEWWC